MSDVSPFLGADGPIAIAHRGGTDEFPENTMAAFEHAVDLGYDHLETDVHATADGILAAFHDSRLDRLTDRAGRIRDLPWSEVGAARIEDAHAIPTFAELLHAFPDAKLTVDPKHGTAMEPLLKIIQAAAAQDRVCVGSFSDARIAEARRRLGPRLTTGLGPRSVARLKAASRGLPTGTIRGEVAHVPERVVDAAFVDEAHRRGMHVHVWTVNDRETMERLLDLGVDGIISDRLALLQEVLAERT